VESAGLVEEVERDLQSLKWHLWNGNVEPALRVIDGLKQLLGGEEMSARRQKLLKAVRECGTYIATNQAFIPDDGDRYRNHETVSTAFTESARIPQSEEAGCRITAAQRMNSCTTNASVFTGFNCGAVQK